MRIVGMGRVMMERCYFLKKAGLKSTYFRKLNLERVCIYDGCFTQFLRPEATV